MREESVSVQVDKFDRSTVTEDKMVVDTFEEQLKMAVDSEKDCAEGIKNEIDVNGEAMILDGSPPDSSKLVEDVKMVPKQSKGGSKIAEKGVGKPVKRKRPLIDVKAKSMDKQSLIAECRTELDCLFEYYKELSAPILSLEESLRSSINSLIACLLEESSLSFSKLVEVVYEELKGKEEVTLASVRSAVLSVGQRISYGFTNAEADVLEDESESCLWCWETRELKLLPVNKRKDLNIRRLGRKKVHERIYALSATISALEAAENEDNDKSNLSKASMKLGKTISLDGIRSLVVNKKQKTDISIAEKTATQKENQSICEVQKEKLQTEKEMKRLQEEAEKEVRRREKIEAEAKKQQKKQLEEAEKEAKRREKEEAECKKQLKKQLEEAERDRRRREREEAELKKQLSVKKQATIMERFLKTKKSSDDSHCREKQSSIKDTICGFPCKVVVSSTTSMMDHAFSSQGNIALEDFRRLHADGWKKLSSCNRSCHWGIRQNPKIKLFKELKLHESSTDLDLDRSESPVKEVASCKNSSKEPSLSKLGGQVLDNSSGNDHMDVRSLSARLLRKKLLQFAKSNRPAYYGTWSNKSKAVGPRHPFIKDPDLDYDVDSDEEWEEEEPGESLSDCEKDADDEKLEEENLKFDDEEESEDGFFVPDGYFSESEGVQVDGGSDDETRNSTSGQSEVESEEIKIFLQQKKCLQTSTQQALRKSHPLVISNLMHEKSDINIVEDVNAISKTEQMCLRALCMQACPGACTIDLSVDTCKEKEDQEVPRSQNKSNITPTPSTATTSDSDLPEFVSSIQSNSQGISKVLESLQGKFPTIPKSQLRNKIKEISTYVDNRWQVKKEILVALGLSPSPEKGLKPKGITSFFSKRCLPPERESIGTSGSSPQQVSKTKVSPGTVTIAAADTKS